MIDSTSVLFGLEDEFVVTGLERLSKDDLRVVIEHRDREAPCPACGVLTSKVKERPLVRVKDLHACGQVIELWPEFGQISAQPGHGGWRSGRPRGRRVAVPRR